MAKPARVHQVAAMLSRFAAITATPAEARGTWAISLAQDARSALRTIFGFVCEPFEPPMLTAEVVSRTADALSLASGLFSRGLSVQSSCPDARTVMARASLRWPSSIGALKRQFPAFGSRAWTRCGTGSREVRHA